MKKTVRGMALGNSKKRGAYRDRRRAQLDEWSAKLDVWQARARKTKADVKIRYHEGLEELQDALETMRRRVGELETAGEDTWYDLKEGVDDAASEAKRVMRRVSRRLDR